MTHYRPTSFGMGGRAAPVRVAFHAAGLDFEDARISCPEFMEMRKNRCFNCVPVLDHPVVKAHYAAHPQ